MTLADPRRSHTLVILAGLLPGLLVATLAAAPQMVGRTVYVPLSIVRQAGTGADCGRFPRQGGRACAGIAQAEVGDPSRCRSRCLIDDGGPRSRNPLRRPVNSSNGCSGGRSFRSRRPAVSPRPCQFTGDPRRVYEAPSGHVRQRGSHDEIPGAVLDTPAAFCAGDCAAVIVAIVE
jgi:hypothetical protein